MNNEVRNIGLRQDINVRTDQIKSANDWEKAFYDDDFRKALGLPPEPFAANQSYTDKPCIESR